MFLLYQIIFLQIWLPFLFQDDSEQQEFQLLDVSSVKPQVSVFSVIEAVPIDQVPLILKQVKIKDEDAKKIAHDLAYASEMDQKDWSITYFNNDATMDLYKLEATKDKEDNVTIYMDLFNAKVQLPQLFSEHHKTSREKLWYGRVKKRHWIEHIPRGLSSSELLNVRDTMLAAVMQHPKFIDK